MINDKMLQTTNDMQEFSNDTIQFESDDIIYPYYCINTKELDAEGDDIPKRKIYNTVSKEIYNDVLCALIFNKKFREFTKFNVSTNSYDEPICYSDDKITGHNVEQNIYSPCKDCIHKIWRQGENNKVQDCKEKWLFLAFDLEKKELFKISFSGIAIQDLKKIITKYLNNAFGPGKHAPWYALKIKISSEWYSNNLAAKWVFKVEGINKGLSQKFKKIHNDFIKLLETKNIYADNPIMNNEIKNIEIELNNDDEVPQLQDMPY